MLNKKGTTLIEVLVSAAVVGFLVLTIYLTLTSAVSNMGESKQRIGAMAIANEKMEIMRNLNYEELGVVDGLINGPMLSSETITRNGFDYDVSIDIRYIDDNVDGSGVADSISTDYKLVQVTVEWDHMGSTESVEFNSNFVPDGVETNMGGGTLVLNTMTSGGQIVAGVEVNLDSIEDSPNVNYTTSTNNSGGLELQGVPSQTYRITLSKDGYESVQTYPNPPESAFTPVNSDFYIDEGNLNAKNFFIDQASDLIFKAIDITDESGISGIEIQLQGGKKIGSDPETYNLNDISSTNSSGEIDYDNISPGVYEIINKDSLGNTDYEFVGSTAETNFELESDEDKTIDLMFADKNKPSLFLTILDNSNDEPIQDIQIGVVGPNDFDQSAETGENGTAFFPQITDPIILMENVDYTVEIKSSDYQEYSDIITINDLTKLEIKLDPI